MNTEENKNQAPNTGTPASPKTNQDFNKKKPEQNDPELRKTPEDVKHEDEDLLEDESLDPGDSDGNGNLINESDDEGIVDKNDEELIDEEDNIDMHTRQTGVKNPDARELE